MSCYKTEMYLGGGSFILKVNRSGINLVSRITFLYDLPHSWPFLYDLFKLYLKESLLV